jgi:PAS domain S-box-containing protein
MTLPTLNWQTLRQSADRTRQAGTHEQAIDLYSQALAQPDVSWSEYCAMMMARAESRQMLGETAAVDAELTKLAEQAAARGDDAVQAAAMTELSQVLRYWGDPKRGLQLAQEALQSAERTGQPDLKAEALIAIGRNQLEMSELDAAQETLEAAQALIGQENVPEQVKIYQFESGLAMRLAQYQRGDQASERGLRLARLTGRRDWEGAFLNSLAISTRDLALQGSLWEQALAAFNDVGDRLHQSMILINRSGWLAALGLYERATEVARQSLQMSRAMRQDADIMFTMQYLGLTLREAGDLAAADACLDEGVSLAHKTNSPYMEFTISLIQAISALYHDQPQTAFDILQRIVPLIEPLPQIAKANLKAYQAIACRLVGDGPAARRYALQAISMIDVNDYGNIDIPVDELYWWCYRGLTPQEGTTEAGKPISDELWQVLDLGRQALLAPIENLSDAGLRRGYLHRVRFRRLIIREWLKWAGAHGVGSEEMAAFTSHVQRPGRLNDVFRRLLAVGVRLNAQRDPARLPAEIVEEVSELTGAERIALVLFDPQGARRTAGVLLPKPAYPAMSGTIEPAPDQDAFLTEIEPALEEATRTRQGFVHQLNPTGWLTEQRSVMVASLVSQGRLVGLIYTDLTGCFGRFEPEDLDLLSVLANQSAVAIENADWSATLTNKVAERTAELEQSTRKLIASNDRLEQRTAELTIINRVQEGLVRQLDFQAIIDLVGDEIMRVFPPPKEKARLHSVFIALYDSPTNMIQFPYWADGIGDRFHEHPIELGPGLTSTVIQSRQPLVLRSWNDSQSLGAVTFDDGLPDEFSQSWLGVPILIGDRVTGVICVQDPRVDLFTESHVRLLSTLAASLGVALENARLFAETQRLLEETEQRNNELAIINEIQQGLATKLDFQDIVDLVGEKVGKIFAADGIKISLFNPKTQLLHILYNYLAGFRENEKTTQLEPSLTSRVIETRQPLMVGTIEEAVALGAVIEQIGPDASDPDEQDANSSLWVPLLTGNEVTGVINVSRFKPNSYKENDLDLLQTLAASLSVALENARLFAETQRLLEETRQRASELAIINHVSQAMSSQLDVDAIIRTVGDQVRDSFHSEVTNIALYDSVNNLIHLPYSFDREYVSTPPFPYGSGLSSKIIDTRQPLILGSFEEIASAGAILTQNAPDDELMPQSYLGVPIIIGEKVIGVIDVQSFQQHNYDERHVRMLSTMASSMGIALENARLFAETQRLLEETRQRAAELAIINSVSEIMTRQLEPENISRIVGDQIREIFKADTAYISLYDPENSLINHLYYYDKGYVQVKPFPLGRGLTSKVIQTRQPLLLNTREEFAARGAIPVDSADGKEDQNQSSLGVPIFVGDRVFGVVTLQSYTPYYFNETHLHLLTTIANNMGGALENARLLSETRRRMSELVMLSEVGRALSSTLEVDELLQLIYEQTSRVLYAENMFIGLYDPVVDEITYVFSRNVEEVAPGTRVPASEGLTGQIVRTRKPVFVREDIETSPTTNEEIIGRPASAWLGVPMLLGERVLGVIAVQHYSDPNAYDGTDRMLLEAIAGQAAVALENARLFQETHRRAEEMAALAEIGNDIAATHDLGPVLERIVQRSGDLLKVSDIALYMLQPDGQTLQAEVVFGETVEEIKASPIRLGVGITGIVALNGIAEMVNYPSLDPRVVHIPGTSEESDVSEGMVVAPLHSRGELIGVITIWRQRSKGPFTQTDLDLLVSLARQAAIAIESARLYMETENRASQMATLAEAGREISSSLNLQTVLESIASRAHTVCRAHNTILRLADPDGKFFRTIVALGKYADQFKVDVIELGEGITGNIALSGKPEIIDNTDLDPRSVHVAGTPEEEESLEALMVAPLISAGNTIGVMSLYRSVEAGRFTQADLDFLSGLARQAAIAIENARLFEAAQESQHRMANIIDFLPDATLVVDSQGRLIAWNRAIEEMTGVKATDMLGKGNYEYALPFYGGRRQILIDLVLLPDEEIEKRYAHIKRLGTILVGEAVVPLLKGRSAYLYATASALWNSKGEIVGAIETIRDISDRKRAEQELSQAKAEAEAANEAKSAFLATMSHEIRTPMNAIIGMSGLLLNTELTEQQREFADITRNSADALLTIINDILDFSKIEAGKLELEIAPFDLRGCVESAVDLLATPAAEKKLDLAIEIATDVPKAIVSDGNRLRQILINLLNNAVKFTELGEVVLTVGSEGVAENNQSRLHFQVRDTGIGIPTDRLDRLFQSFSQVDASTSRRYGGTGLGLAISKRLVEMMGGTMWVESQFGVGSTFHFTIVGEIAPAVAYQARFTGEQLDLTGRRLLVVDDNPTNRRIIKLQTKDWGMQTRETGSPEEALGWIRRGDPFDLAILDFHMPVMDGITLAQEIRKLRDAKTLPLVMLSSLGKHEEGAQAVEWAAYLTKPIKQSQLFNVISSILGTSMAPTSAQRAPQADEQPQKADAEMGKRHPLSILLAEDNAFNQKLAIYLLKQMGYQADLATNGLEAIRSVERQQYDVILMDVQMPEMDGLEASRQICIRWPQPERPHIIAMTANAMQGDREMCLAAGMDDYISKPIRIADLAAALDRAARKK